ncbi:MAG: glycosyltransferase family 9 protein [Candidatus Kapabacteria bacterium]|nr:glycosyltransferase family 9 protein [Candidatus Kapabacteria bacterium]
MTYPEFRIDCLHFRGDIPCKPHKDTGVHCASCQQFSPQDGWILVIKLGAIGDVIRTTPLLHKLRSEYPTKSICWLTYSPDILPAAVHKPLAFSPESLLWIQNTDFDLCINLDKDPHACALASSVRTNELWGFTLRNGKPSPANERATHKFNTGLFDDVNKANTKHYVDEIFDICGWSFAGEEYVLDVPASGRFASLRTNGKPLIGLNTGCGDRWTSRKWRDEQWIELISLLQEAGMQPMLLGGKQEHDVNTKFHNETGALYPGFFPLRDFMEQMNECDAVVSAVTMAMHVAVGLRKPLILMNNIFNPHEFELYGRGEIIQPDKSCHCFFRGTCVNKEYHCMDSLQPAAVAAAVQRSLKQ